MESNKRISDVRSYFTDNYNYVSLDQLSDGFILEFLSRSYLERLSFEMKMDCLYDYILSQNLCEVVE
jgi:hypothetical protein